MQFTFVHDKKKYENLISFISPLNGGDDIFDTKTLTFAITDSNFHFDKSLFRIVESGSTLGNKFWLCCSVITQLVSHKICSHFAIS